MTDNRNPDGRDPSDRPGPAASGLGTGRPFDGNERRESVPGGNLSDAVEGGARNTAGGGGVGSFQDEGRPLPVSDADRTQGVTEQREVNIAPTTAPAVGAGGLQSGAGSSGLAGAAGSGSTTATPGGDPNAISGGAGSPGGGWGQGGTTPAQEGTPNATGQATTRETSR
ncbi:MAG TPA: hypothetical protein VED40_06880 [Azospirillaceae bacterium]|nr:hypothetical protein [Azospirillaceae bacterium]